DSWHPFADRHDFDWADYHYVEVQSSEDTINRGLDLWMAEQIQVMQSAEGFTPPPWSSTKDLYKTIDAIEDGDVPFERVFFRYSGVIEENAPSWKTATYELCVRDVRAVVQQQMATPQFKEEFQTAPYRQYDRSGHRIYSNFMSGDWAWREADKIAEDPRTHGAMVVPVDGGLDKTAVSVATGSQQYHPYYVSPANLSNAARRGHGNGVIPVAFIPIVDVSKFEKKTKEFKRFARQLYHACIARIYAPLREGMTTPEVIKCPDGHFRRAIYSIGPVIADYPEQVWLTGIVQGWCPKCFAKPGDLDDKKVPRRNHEKTDFLLCYFDSGQLWDIFGVRDDVVPFTHSYPRADIHELIAPDLLHQLIKGTFKDHLVTWINDYIKLSNSEARALEIIQDIDHRIAAMPPYPGLRRFKDGRDFAQWTGDDSKALMKVYLPAIVGYVPDDMVECLSSFLGLCYILRRNAINVPALNQAKEELARFHRLREIFVETGTRTHCSLPRQHSLPHFITGVTEFGAANGTCSSITESKHIEAVKDTWRRTNRFEALYQMLTILVRMHKMQTLKRKFEEKGMLQGSTAAYMALAIQYESRVVPTPQQTHNSPEAEEAPSDDDDDDVVPLVGPRFASSVKLAKTKARGNSRSLHGLATELNLPQLVPAFLSFLYLDRYDREPLENLSDTMAFSGRIYTHHSATARFFTPSDTCGVGGMQQQTIRCNPEWHEKGRFDTVFVQGDGAEMKGLMVAQLRLLFSFVDTETGRSHECALVNWFPLVDDEPDPVTGMWMVEREEGIGGERDEEGGAPPLQVISLATVVRGAHLAPVFGDDGNIPGWVTYLDSLDVFSSFYVNHFVDHHAHELIMSCTNI
ncbi:hypothetical protein FA13DRAFT_1633446, partial [Coprinellus micaceus]